MSRQVWAWAGEQEQERMFPIYAICTKGIFETYSSSVDGIFLKIFLYSYGTCFVKKKFEWIPYFFTLYILETFEKLLPHYN